MKIVISYQEDDREELEMLAKFLNLPMVNKAAEAEEADIDDYTHILALNVEGLSLRSLETTAGASQRQPTRVDFLDPSLNYRRSTFGKNQGLAKAVGLNKHAPMHVVDATAGLGKDSFILASLGCSLTMLEKSPLIYCLLQDGLKRAENFGGKDLAEIVSRMTLHQINALEWFSEIQKSQQERPHVIYLDPMFPPRNKSANVKKDMALLQEVLAYDVEIDELITAALECAKHRVVVKRPGGKAASGLSSTKLKPSFIVPGKSAHFEIYV